LGNARSTMAQRPSRTVFRRALFWTGALVVCAAAGYGVWHLLQPKPDLVAIFQLNNRGVGHTEQFEYGKAVEAFEEVVKFAPDWLPGEINLGIALLNQAGAMRSNSSEEKAAKEGTYARAIALFEGILAKAPRDSWARPYAHFCLGTILFEQAQWQKALINFETVTRLDPTDPFGWYRLGDTYRVIDELEQAAKCFKRARELDPHLRGALYGLAQHPYLRDQDPEYAQNA